MAAVSCGAVLALTPVFADAMAARGRGGIVLFSSIVAAQGVPRSANYVATKAYSTPSEKACATNYDPSASTCSSPHPAPSTRASTSAPPRGWAAACNPTTWPNRPCAHSDDTRSYARASWRSCSAGRSPRAHPPRSHQTPSDAIARNQPMTITIAARALAYQWRHVRSGLVEELAEPRGHVRLHADHLDVGEGPGLPPRRLLPYPYLHGGPRPARSCRPPGSRPSTVRWTAR